MIVVLLADVFVVCLTLLAAVLLFCFGFCVCVCLVLSLGGCILLVVVCGVLLFRFRGGCLCGLWYDCGFVLLILGLWIWFVVAICVLLL